MRVRGSGSCGGRVYKLAYECVFCYKTPKRLSTMKKQFFILALLGTATAAQAASLPDYPVVYNPQTGGPVQNPNYAQTPPPSAPAPQAMPASPQSYPAADGQPQGYYSPLVPRYMDPSSYEVGLNLEYGFKASPDHRYACDIAGFELEGAYRLSKRHAITASIGFAGGGQTNDFLVVNPHGGFDPFTDSYDRSSFTLMVGYRFTQPLGRRWVLQLGAKCGMDVQTLDIDYGYGWRWPYDDWGDGQRDTDVGLAYAGYVNFGYRLTSNTVLYVGYQFRGSTAEPKMNYSIPEVPHEKAGSMRWHEVRIGASFRF